MPRLRCRFPDVAVALVAVAACSVPARAWAQACCAGGIAVTPGRLLAHERMLVGLQLKAGLLHGSYDPGGGYLGSPSGASEEDFEEDLLASVRFAPRGQIALFVPLVETRRATPQDGAYFGGGIGDVNASVRYDFLGAGESPYVPGIALLAGVTRPTGTPPDAATPPLAVDATGVGALQGNVALALEQTFGPWLVNATAIAAGRAPRNGETLGTQVTLLAAGAYNFDGGAAVGLSAAYAFEGDATTSSGAFVANSSKRSLLATLTGLYPLSMEWRLLGGFYMYPPFSGVGSNQPATAGLTFTVIRSWS
jgi:hypothetical protein